MRVSSAAIAGGCIASRCFRGEGFCATGKVESRMRASALGANVESRNARLVVLLGLTLAVARADAATLLSFDPVREKILYGKAPFGNAAELPATAHSRGKF